MLKLINRVIKVLIFSDFLLNAGWGLLGPIFAIFLTQQIKGGDIKLAGFCAGTYWIVKSICQPFIAHHLDKNHGEVDDFYFLVSGYFLVSFVPIGYIFATLPWHVLGLQVIYALGMACAIPTWAGIFTRHIDKGRENFEWSLESTSLGFAAGVTGALGGLIASWIGFKLLLMAVSLFTLCSGAVLFLIIRHISPHVNHLIRPIPEVKDPASPK